MGNCEAGEVEAAQKSQTAPLRISCFGFIEAAEAAARRDVKETETVKVVAQALIMGGHETVNGDPIQSCG